MVDKVKTLVRNEEAPVMIYLPKPFAEIRLPPRSVVLPLTQAETNSPLN